MALGIDDKEKQPGQDSLAAKPAVPGAPSTPAPGPQKKATGFTNLSKYLGANVGSKLGSAVAGNIQGTTQQGQSGLQAAQQRFGQQAQAGRLGTQQDVGKLQQVLQDPTKASEADVKEFERFRTTGYGGPQGLQTAQQLGQQAQRSQQMAGAIGSQSGRMGLLQQAVGKGQYSTGQQRLDELLLGRQAGSQLREARRGAATTAGQIERGIGEARGLAQQYGQEAQAFKEQVGKELTGAESPITGELTKRAEAEAGKKEELGRRLKEGLASGELTSEDAALLGLQEGQKLYGADPRAFLQEGITPATAQNVAKQEEMAKLNALARLGGKQAFGTEEQAGSFLKDQFKLDPKFQETIAARKGEYEKFTTPEREAQERAVRQYTDWISSPEIQAIESQGSPGIMYDPERGGSPEEFEKAKADWEAAAPQREAQKQALIQQRREEAKAGLEAGNIGDVLSKYRRGGAADYHLFRDLASGGGGGYDLLRDYQARQARLGDLEKQYGGQIRFKQLGDLMGVTPGKAN